MVALYSDPGDWEDTRVAFAQSVFTPRRMFRTFLHTLDLGSSPALK